MKIKIIPLSSAWHEIKDSDLLLWRGHGWISSFGRGIHYHASKLAWWGDDLMVLDTHWRRGGDVRLLVNDVLGYSGQLDWFAVNPNNLPYDREAAIHCMRGLVGTRYGFLAVTHAGLFHAPFVRRFIHPEIDDEAECSRPPFCSHAVSRADRVGGGCDPVPWLADSVTEPADLARSAFYEYRGTLVWDEASRQFVKCGQQKLKQGDRTWSDYALSV